MRTIEVEAHARTRTGKQSARALRGTGFLPAVFYGYGIEPVHISLDTAKFMKLLGKERMEGTFIKLQIRDESGTVLEKLSVLKEMQVDTLNRLPLHVDFNEIKMDRELTVDIPVHFTGQPRGVEEEGGEVQQLKREVKVSGLPGSLPEVVELDISELMIGDTLKVGDLSLGDGVKILDGEDVALVTVSAVRVTEEVEEAAEEEEAAAGEGVGEETAGAEQDGEQN